MSYQKPRRRSLSAPTQDVVRSLHQQRSQIRIAFLADVHLWLTLT